MATLAMLEFRQVLMDLATALSEPGRRYSLDQVVLKGHELQPGAYGPQNATPLFLLFSAILVHCGELFGRTPVYIHANDQNSWND